PPQPGQGAGARAVTADERLEPADELREAAEREIRLSALGEAGEPQLLQARGLGLRPRLVAEAGERPSPKRNSTWRIRVLSHGRQPPARARRPAAGPARRDSGSGSEQA